MMITMNTDDNKNGDDDLFACSMMLHRWSVSNSFLSLTYKDNADDDADDDDNGYDGDDGDGGDDGDW